MNDENHEYLGSTEAVLKRIQERSDDFEKVVLHPPGGQFTQHGRATSEMIPYFVMTFHLVSGRKHSIFGSDVETVLNDGILNRMKIKIELGYFGPHPEQP